MKEKKAAFAQQLQMALNQFALKKAILNRHVKPIKGGVDLARQFNLRHSGKISISTQAAHKWLKGEVIPRVDKIKTLAEWLGVSAHWLHYGPPPESEALKMKQPPSLQASRLVEKIEALPERQRYLIEELVVCLLKIQLR